MTFITNVLFGQISINDIEQADLLMNGFQNHTDSVSQLKQGAKVYYISDSLFKGIMLTLQNGNKIEIDLRYNDSYGGYAEIGADFENYVLVKHRGSGSGNSEKLQVINKETGEDKWLGNYPFYLDLKNEIGVYEAYKDSTSQIVVHDFSTDKTEAYPTPNTKCVCCDCFEVVRFEMESFTMRFIGLDGKTTEIKVKRQK
ncbi:hypothetical protein Oweho_2607 [Owenweeksia hongkongensis DSM 17368]|uniref:Uncharacterized protein n=2 Tax=Owenweeksia TaxID=267986 RepID=G8R8W7_OWEHD|nr:hypothetical protein Oweho_2607 [Owenweeksia hongkongensis DSM 17368]